MSFNLEPKIFNECVEIPIFDSFFVNLEVAEIFRIKHECTQMMLRDQAYLDLTRVFSGFRCPPQRGFSEEKCPIPVKDYVSSI